VLLQRYRQNPMLKGDRVNEQELNELMQAETVTTYAELADGGFTVIDRTDGGLVAHRGILADDEYVDPFVLRAAAEEALGFTYADVSAVYTPGRKSVEQLQLRAKIDARMLELSRSGGNMTQLASALGLGTSTVDRALKRARQAWIEPVVKRPAVTHVVPCFRCEAPAKPRRRRFSLSPEGEIGTVNLCDDCYADGFIVIPRQGGRKAVKRPVNAVGLIQDRDTRTFGGHRHYGPPWVPTRDRVRT